MTSFHTFLMYSIVWALGEISRKEVLAVYVQWCAERPKLQNIWLYCTDRGTMEASLPVAEC